jgi:phosphatidylinositol kinase/protein kinase (PI-3  family)
MFHVDFGFILGRDPKPMPAPMKLTTEMINAMGGQSRYGGTMYLSGVNTNKGF